LVSRSQIFEAIEQDMGLKQRFRRYQLAARYSTGRNVLEMGCELGVGAYYLAENARFVLGLDNSREWLTQAVKLFRRSNLRFVVMDCTHLAIADGVFDLVCLFEVIEHVMEPRIVLDEARRALANGGIFLLSTPNRLVASAEVSRVPPSDHVKEYSYLELEGLIGDFYSDFKFYGQKSLTIMPLQTTQGFPEFREFSRFVVACRKSVSSSRGREEICL